MKKGGDTSSKKSIITLPNVSTSQGLKTLDPERDVPCSDLSGEVRKLSGNSSSDEAERVYHTIHPLHGSEGNVGSPLPDLTLPTSPLPEGTFLAPILEVSPTKSGGERQLLGKSSLDEPSRIFRVGTSSTLAGMSVSETPTECVSVIQSPQHPKSRAREKTDTLTEHVSEKPQTPQLINLDNYVSKAEFERQISKRDQEIVSLKERPHLTEVNLTLTQAVVHAIQEQLAALSTPPIPYGKDNATEGEKKAKKRTSSSSS